MPALVLATAAFAGQAHTSAHGRSLAEWMSQYWSWFIDGSAANGGNNLRFIPLPAGTQTDDDPVTFTGSLTGDFPQGKSFALPVFFWTGEAYANGTQDPVSSAPSDAVFLDAEILVTLDGKPIFDSETDDMSKFLVPPTFLAQTAMYAEPHDDDAVGVAWVKGIGFIHGGLHKGTHTIHLSVYSPDFNLVFDNTWTLTVRK